MTDAKPTQGTLSIGEMHPACGVAMLYLIKLGKVELFRLLEAFSSCAIENNRSAEICAETLRRILAKEPVSDRYLLGLAFTVRDMLEATDEQH